MTISTRSEMPTTDVSAESVAATLMDTAFVHVICRSDGDAIAAAGLLARTLRRENIPFQIRADQFGRADPTADDQDEDLCIALGLSHSAADININPFEQSVTRSVYAVIKSLNTPQQVSQSSFDTVSDASGDNNDVYIPPTDTLLALAGIVASGASLNIESVVGTQEQTQTQSEIKNDTEFAASLLETLTTTDMISVNQQPGVGIPVNNIVDGLAHSTLIHASFSGDVDATRTMMTEIDTDADICFEASDDSDNTGGSAEAALLKHLSAEDQRMIASAVTIDIVKTSIASTETAVSIEQALHPQYLSEAPMTTVEGYADVLRSASRERPGAAIALAINQDVNDAAVTAWREHAQTVHAILQTAHTGRYDGVYVLRCHNQDDTQSPTTNSDPSSNADANVNDNDGDPTDTIESGTTAAESESVSVSVDDIPTPSPGQLLTAVELAARYQAPEPLVLGLCDEFVGVAVQSTVNSQSGSINTDAVALAETLRTNAGADTTDASVSDDVVSHMNASTSSPESNDTDNDHNGEINQMQHGWIGDSNQALVRVDPTIPPAEIIAIVREFTREEL